MDLQIEIDRYLEWNREKSRQLSHLPLAAINDSEVVPIIDMPTCPSLEMCRRIVGAAKEAGYVATNVGLTNVQRGGLNDEVMGFLQRSFQIKSAHGSSIKHQLKTGRQYRDILREDLATLERYDPDGKWLVNYDVFAGHLPTLSLGPNFLKTQKENIAMLNNALGVAGSGRDAQSLLLERIIKDVALVFKGTGRKICFEMPGSKGWSMLPGIGSRDLARVVRLINRHFPDATICIDIGHVLTWTRNPKVLNDYVDNLAPYWGMLSMLHISSAGSWPPPFVGLYRRVFGKDMPSWHVKGLDLQLPVCEPEQLELLRSMRARFKGRVFEVSETRMPCVAIADYFTGHANLEAIDNESYFEELIRQGNTLGYASKK